MVRMLMGMGWTWAGGGLISCRIQYGVPDESQVCPASCAMGCWPPRLQISGQLVLFIVQHNSCVWGCYWRRGGLV